MATKDKTVADIVTEYLKANGYDGLVSKNGECACVVPCLMPCRTYGVNICRAGHKVTCLAGHKINCLDEDEDVCPDGSDFHIEAGKKGDNDGTNKRK